MFESQRRSSLRIAAAVLLATIGTPAIAGGVSAAQGDTFAVSGGAVSFGEVAVLTVGNEATPAPATPAASTPVSGDTGDLEKLGLVGDGEYESPQFGTSVEWNDDWVLDDESGDPLFSDEAEGTDGLYFIPADWTDASNYGSISVRIFAASATDTPESVVEYWTSDEYLNGGSGDGLEVLMSDTSRTEGGVVSLMPTDEGELVQYISVLFVDAGETAVVVEFYATPESVEDVLASAQAAITVDGKDVLTLFEPADIAAAVN